MKILNKEIFIDHSNDDLFSKELSLLRQFIVIAEYPFITIQKILRFTLALMTTISFKYLVFSSALSNCIQATISRSSVNKNESISKTHQFYH